MPKGPNGEKRPADAIARAVMVAQIATGEVDGIERTANAAAELGKLGGKARALKLSPERRSEIARKAASARYAKS